MKRERKGGTTNTDKRISECLRFKLEAFLGAGQRNQLRNKPKQTVAEDHLQLHGQPHRNIQELAPPGKFWQCPSLSRHLLQQSVTTKYHNAEHLSCLSCWQATQTQIFRQLKKHHKGKMRAVLPSIPCLCRNDFLAAFGSRW